MLGGLLVRKFNQRIDNEAERLGTFMGPDRGPINNVWELSKVIVWDGDSSQVDIGITSRGLASINWAGY